MLYDIIFILLLVFFTFYGYKRGLLRTLLAILSFVLAGAVALLLAKLAAPFVYDTVVRPIVVNAVKDSLQSVSSHEGFEAAQKAVKAVPSVLLGILSHFGYSDTKLADYLFNAQQEGNFTVAELTADLVRFPAVGIIALLLFFVFFIILLVVFLAVARKVGKKIRVPFFGFADSVIGAVLGFAEGVLVVFLLATLMWACVPFLPSDIRLLSPEYVMSSGIIRFVFSKELGFLLQNLTYRLEKLKELGI